MSSLVREIQMDALRPTVAVSDLLRKALVVSTKLNVRSNVEWINSELHGYDAELEVPVYRVLEGIPQVFNPMRGYQALQMPADMQEIVCKVHLGWSVAEIEAIIARNESMVRMGFNAKMTEALTKMISYNLRPSMVMSASMFVRILDSVRSRVLQWALDLEAAGIVGDGLSFSPGEVKAAQQVTNITNHIGSMHNSQIQQLSSGTQSFQMTEQREVLTELLTSIKSAASGHAAAEQVNIDADTVLLQLQSEQPKQGIVEESLRSLRAVLEGAAGGALGNYLPQLVGVMVSLGFS